MTVWTVLNKVCFIDIISLKKTKLKQLIVLYRSLLGQIICIEMQMNSVHERT